MKRTSTLGYWQVEVGYDRGSYKPRFAFLANDENRAVMYFNALNTHSGYKKRLISPEGKVVARVLT